MTNKRNPDHDESSLSARWTETSERLHRAVVDLLARDGYQRVTIEGVAAASGVAKTTIYRRWSTKAEMVFDVALHSSGALPEVRDTGTLLGDLSSLVDRAIAFVAHEPGRTVLPGLIGDMAADPALAERFTETFVKGARVLFADVLDRAIARGELAAPQSPEDLQAALVGTAFMWVHAMPGSDPPDFHDRLLRLAIASVKQTPPD